ncbi:MAG: hypothetical protein K2J54_05770 [Clostridia bacterium]|nr:hypothetical protein [Clostridia bacterium]MDE7084288.1 hypothetical protein [Clostridia bacterium]MDE7257591.1 hypothetical protein [Clostridia bacterium]
MKVKEILCQTMRLVGRTEAADCIERNSLTDEAARLKRALLTYLNAVLDELARGYFPLDTEEEMCSENGVYAFADFLKAPFKINRVTDGKNPIGWHICPDYLLADAEKITVYYEYLPQQLSEDDEFFYPVFAVSPRLVQYGMAAEYFLVAGDGEGYNAWESKYREEIEMLLSRSGVKERIPPRRWI